MKRRWNANTWIAVIVIGVVVLIAFDAVRAALRPPTVTPKPAQASQVPVVPKRPSEPDFNVGDTAPDFSLPDRYGKTHRLSELVKGDTLLMFTCGCAHCLDLQNYVGLLSKHMKGRPPAVINVTSLPPDAEAAWLRNTQLQQTMVYEKKDGPVVKTYRGHPCPRVYRVEPGLKVTWIGPSLVDTGTLENLGDAVAANLGFTPAEGHALAPTNLDIAIAKQKHK